MPPTETQAKNAKPRERAYKLAVPTRASFKVVAPRMKRALHKVARFRLVAAQAACTVAALSG